MPPLPSSSMISYVPNVVPALSMKKLAALYAIRIRNRITYNRTLHLPIRCGSNRMLGCDPKNGGDSVHLRRRTFLKSAVTGMGVVSAFKHWNHDLFAAGKHIPVG